MKTKTKQRTRTGTESEKWASHGGFSVERGKGGIGGEGGRGGMLVGRGPGWRRIKGRKTWDNFNSITNKIY